MLFDGLDGELDKYMYNHDVFNSDRTINMLYFPKSPPVSVLPVKFQKLIGNNNFDFPGICSMIDDGSVVRI